MKKVELINPNDLHIVSDATSYTGWRWRSLHESESGINYAFGLPVTPFELALYRVIKKQREEIKALRGAL